MKQLIFIVLFIIQSSLIAAPVDTFTFETPEQEQAFHKLSGEVRCLVCQNQSISDSNAGLAKDLRTEIHKMLLQGKSEEEIAEFMVERYGDYVLYDPPLKPTTWLLWFGPALVFLIAVIYVVSFLREQNLKRDVEELSADELERLSSLQAESKTMTARGGQQEAGKE